MRRRFRFSASPHCECHCLFCHACLSDPPDSLTVSLVGPGGADCPCSAFTGDWEVDLVNCFEHATSGIFPDGLYNYYDIQYHAEYFICGGVLHSDNPLTFDLHIRYYYDPLDLAKTIVARSIHLDASYLGFFHPDLEGVFYLYEEPVTVPYDCDAFESFSIPLTSTFNSGWDCDSDVFTATLST